MQSRIFSLGDRITCDSGRVYVISYDPMISSSTVSDFFLVKPEGNTSERKFLKRYKDHYQADAMYRNELKILEELKNSSKEIKKSVVKIVDYSEKDRSLILEKEEGMDLDYFLGGTNISKFGLLETIALTKNISGIFAGIHDKHNIVHADIKPGNIIIDPFVFVALTEGRNFESFEKKGAVKICDFGLSLKNGKSEPYGFLSPGHVFGTLPYISPELMTGKGIGEKPSDVWAFGVMSYEVLSGRNIFGGYCESVHSVYRLVNQKGFPNRIEGESSGLDKIIYSMLEINPDNRPTMREIHNETSRIYCELMNKDSINKKLGFMSWIHSRL